MTAGSIRSARTHSLGWLIAFAGLMLLVVDRFDLRTIRHRVELPDGNVVGVPNGWYTVDHPFHVSRAHSLLESLRGGELLRWFGEHHGGYPAEFYPTGAAWLDTAIWALTFGLLPVEVVHKVLIALIVLTPAFVFLWWVKRDRLSPGIALLAGAGHVVIAGEWWSGGWTEVVLWGLVTNVAAQTAILGAVAGVHGWLNHGRSRDLGWAVLFAGLALGINPRTALGLVAIGLAAVIVALMPPNSAGIGTILRRGLVLVGLSFAAAAPVLMALIRYRDLYYFVHYEEYADLAAWWESSQRALWTPIFWLALAGLVTGLLRPNRPLTRTVALAAAIYMAATATMVISGAGIFEQLELTRLMPFQRMLLFYLAAVAVSDVIELIIRSFNVVGLRSLSPPVLVTDGNSPSAAGTSHHTTSSARNETGGDKVRSPTPVSATPWMSMVMAGFAFALVFNVVLEPAGWVPEEQRGLRTMGSSAQPATVDFQRAVELADASAPEGTAILVLGSVLSWHQGLTAPMWSDRRFFYDDWLWYWQRDHVGPYNPDTEHAYPRDADTLTREYLTTHGIGAVIVADASGQANRELASASPLLERVQTGWWFDVHLVNDPVAIVTIGDQPASSIAISNHAITASGTTAGGTALIRHNWHPRWQATVNGSAATVVKRADGYMEVAVPAGDFDLRLEYGLTGLDWIARTLFGLAVAITLMLISGRPRSLHKRAFMPRA